MKKIEQQELQQLQDLQQKSQNFILELGEISYNEILLFQRKEKLKTNLEQLQEEEKTLKEFLIEKYGDNININLETGEY